MVELILSVKVKAPDGTTHAEAARLVQMMIDVGQNDANLTVEDPELEDDGSAEAISTLEVEVSP